METDDTTTEDLSAENWMNKAKAKEVVRKALVRHVRLTNAEAEFAKIFDKTVGRYWDCPKVDGSSTAYGRVKQYREFIIKWTEEIARQLKEAGVSEPSATQLRTVAYNVMIGVKGDYCDTLPRCKKKGGALSAPAVPVCDLFVSEYQQLR